MNKPNNRPQHYKTNKGIPIDANSRKDKLATLRVCQNDYDIINGLGFRNFNSFVRAMLDDIKQKNHEQTTKSR